MTWTVLLLAYSTVIFIIALALVYLYQLSKINPFNVGGDYQFDSWCNKNLPRAYARVESKVDKHLCIAVFTYLTLFTPAFLLSGSIYYIFKWLGISLTND